MLYIAGNLPELGNWDPGQIAMTQGTDSLWRCSINSPAGRVIEFKVTRGSWNNQAVYQKGVPAANNVVRVSRDETVELTPIGWSDQQSELKGGISGTARYHRGMRGDSLRHARDVVVWLPPSYEKNPGKRYPVLYMHDGQNVFDPTTSFIGFDWRADEVADSLIRLGAIEEIIIVGISNSPDRMSEYADTELGRAYARFVVERVKPFIDTTYRTKRDRLNTGVMGSSMGGLISFLFTWWYPDVFSKAGCLSSVFDGRARSILDDVRAYKGVRKDVRWYLDCGGYGGEGSLKPGMDEMGSVLSAKGYVEGRDFIRFFDATADHSERAWASRLWRPMKFLWGK